MLAAADSTAPSVRDLDLARVLLVNGNATARLTLQAVLQASGYQVETAHSSAEALACLDQEQYALVMTGLGSEEPEGDLEVVAHARLLAYQPAVALLTTESPKLPDGLSYSSQRPTLVAPEDLPGLLTTVAEMVSQRAARLVESELQEARQAETRSVGAESRGVEVISREAGVAG